MSGTPMCSGFEIADGVAVGGPAPLLVIGGTCVIENEDLSLQVAEHLRVVCETLGLGFVFKASFDKANRTSVNSYRGPGLQEGLRVLQKVKEQIGVPVLTDVHEVPQVQPASDVVDVLQIPAFLCRQTDLLVAAAQTGRVVNIKKGQFAAGADMGAAVEKVAYADNSNVMLTERGTTFGYHDLVVDMRSLISMRQLGVPVVFDATHSVQQPGGKGHASGGRREYAPALAAAAAAVGIDAIFLESHPRPEEALSDGPNALVLDEVHPVLERVKAIHECR